MKSENYNHGFTLIEILVVVAIVLVVLGFGMVIDLSAFTSDSFYGQESKIVSLLQKARSRAMANILESNHGVCYSAPNYFIFRGSSYSSAIEKEKIVESLDISPISTLELFDCDNGGIVFERLTGKSVTDAIHITYNTQSADIEINNEGRINW